MNLIPEWQKAWHRLWSIRLALLSALFGAIEVGLPYFESTLPGGIFAGLSAATAFAAAIARLIAQPSLND